MSWARDRVRTPAVDPVEYDRLVDRSRRQARGNVFHDRTTQYLAFWLAKLVGILFANYRIVREFALQD